MKRMYEKNFHSYFFPGVTNERGMVFAAHVENWIDQPIFLKESLMANTTHAGTLRPLSETDIDLADRAEDIRGRNVLDAKGEEIGEVDELLIDDAEKKVRFLRVTSGGFLSFGETTFLIPVDAITRISDDAIHIDRAREKVAGSPRYDPDLVERQYLGSLYGYYGYAPYWGPGYMYPSYPYYPSTERGTIVGVFEDRGQAQSAVDELRRADFRDDQIGFVARNDSERSGDATSDAATSGVLGGLALGGSAGALWGLAVAAGLLPGIGPVIAGGALVAIFASAATGAAIAGVVGFLIDLGIPEEEARFYERELQAGRFLVTVKADDRYDQATTILQRFGAFSDPILATPY